MLLYNAQGLKPDRSLIEGSFAPSDVATLDCSVPCTNLDTVLEACTSAGASLYSAAGNSYRVNLLGTAAYAEAEADCGTVTTNLDTVLDLSGGASLGDAGNDWTVRLIGASAAAAGCTVYDDTVNKVVYIIFEAGVDTRTTVEVAIGAYGGVAAVKTAGSAVAALTAADDQGVLQFSGGADQETISVSGNAVTINFEDGVSTVAEVETLIGTLTGDDKILKVKTAGTGASVLTAADDAVGLVSLSGGYTAEDSKRGQGFSVARTATGVYTLTLRDRAKELVGMLVSLQLSTAGDKHAQFGDYSAANKTLPIRIRDISGAGDADVAYNANNRISFKLVYQP